MIHQYQNNGYNIVLDVNSGAVHVVDQEAYDVIEVLNRMNEDHTVETLKSPETAEALKKELSKLGAVISVTNDSLHLHPSKSFLSNQIVATYNDHRMAMAFAPLAIKMNLSIENAQVVSKSYPNFWSDLKILGFEISEY